MVKPQLTTKDIAIIVPVYNRQTIVLETLKSVVLQTREIGKLIIVDDGSTDDTLVFVEQWVTHCPKNIDVLLVHKEHKGASSARNYGLQYCKAFPWVAFLDSDDLWPNDFLERCCDAINRCIDAIAVTVDRKYIDVEGGGYSLKSSRGIEENPTEWIFCKGGGGIGSASVFLRDKVVIVGGYNEKIETGHDTALFLRLSLQGNWLYAVGQPACYRRGLGRLRQEQEHNYEMYKDFLQRWAIIHEDFLTEAGLSSQPCYRQAIAHRWYRAGRALSRAGKISEGRFCFIKSIRWRCFSKAWIYLSWNLVKGWKGKLFTSKRIGLFKNWTVNRETLTKNDEITR